MNINLSEKYIDHNADDLFTNITDEIIRVRDKTAYDIIKPYVDTYGMAEDIQVNCVNKNGAIIFLYVVNWEDDSRLEFAVTVPIGGENERADNNHA